MSLAHDDNTLLGHTVNADPQFVIPHSLKRRVLILSHYPVTAGHPGVANFIVESNDTSIVLLSQWIATLEPEAVSSVPKTASSDPAMSAS